MTAKLSRRALFGFTGIAGLQAAAAAAFVETLPPVPEAIHKRLHGALKRRMGDDLYDAWFRKLTIDAIDGPTMIVSVPVKFLKQWINTYWREDLVACCQAALPEIVDVKLIVRVPTHDKDA